MDIGVITNIIRIVKYSSLLSLTSWKMVSFTFPSENQSIDSHLPVSLIINENIIVKSWLSPPSSSL